MTIGAIPKWCGPMFEGRVERLGTEGTTSVVEISDLTYAVDGTEILHNISVLADEDRIGIVGRNGSGKTTLARVLAGLIEPSSGVVTVCGCELAKDRKTAVRTLGILFQNPDHQIIFPTVEEEVGFGLLQLGLSKPDAAAEAHRVLQSFGKAHWADVAIQQLSQGQRQLVCLISVLAMKPKVIILDEPFAGLDIPTTRQLGRYLDQTSATLIHITHDPEILNAYQRVIWLEKGAVEMDGSAKAVLTAFTNRMEQIGASDDISHISG